MSAASNFLLLEEKIGHVFKTKKLLEEALTHASVIDSKNNNERLEFLGDRVLGLIIADMLYQTFPQEEEGALAKRHTGLVQQAALVSVAGKIGLSGFIRLSPSEEKAGGAQKEAILSDALEALIAAVYLDGGVAAARKFIEHFWQDRIHDDAPPPEDPKTKLQELAQGLGLPLPQYNVIAQTGSDHAPSFEVEVSVKGQGSARAKAASKRKAEKDAAEALLRMIEKK